MVIYCLDYVEFYSGSRASEEYNRELYASLPVKAECIDCGVCLERCPFQVDIVGKMSRAVEVFETAALCALSGGLAARTGSRPGEGRAARVS